MKFAKSSLFRRLFWAFVATLLVTALVLSITMVVMVREERRSALENEVRVQARDVASLMGQYDTAYYWRRDSALATALDRKLTEIRENYQANLWLVNASRVVWVLGDYEYDQAQLNDAAVVEQVYKVLSGEEIRVQGLIPELGSQIVTIGVPWTDSLGRVGGAVLLHISIESLSVDYSDMVKYALVAAGLALLLGTGLALFISKRQTGPVREINEAVTAFAKGDLEKRVHIAGNDELAELGRSINKMAQDLSNLENSRKSFVASVSHELRSPLTCMRGYVEGMLDETIPPEETGKYLTIVLDETKRLTKLVNELLDLSKYESGTIPLHYTDFDLCEQVRQEIIKFEGRIEEKQLEVEVELPEEALFVRADVDRIRQVISNLIDNAVKFAPEYGRLEVRARATERQAELSVFNTGEAIAPEDLPYIFDRFYKAEKAHTSGMGTGLGLSIVKHILDEHGETITVASSALGTTFRFTLARAALDKSMKNGGNP